VSEAPILFEEWPAASRRIAVVTLNTPRTLNGLSLEMAGALLSRLERWIADPDIALVVLRGAGDKAFCTGGDLHGLYQSMVAHRRAGDPDIRANAHAAAFFEIEYRLDYRIHTCPKPVLCWADGLVMGGGVGLMAGASHRVMTERSRLAMPEIAVGLFPDVGASWLLPRVPGRIGRFLALTGARLEAGDAIFAGLADCSVPSEWCGRLLLDLRERAWAGDPDADHRGLTAVLRQHASPCARPGPLQEYAEVLREVCAVATLEEAVVAIAGLPERLDARDSWFAAAAKTLAGGAPGSVRLAWELQRRIRLLSLADAFRVEYVVALHCAAHGDFLEGVRAMLIDKDRSPRWRPNSFARATAGWADAFFESPWRPADHPLADLGASPIEGRAVEDIHR
jgi:enoyl-CoA hydratase/carnithine racemase